MICKLQYTNATFSILPYSLVIYVSSTHFINNFISVFFFLCIKHFKEYNLCYKHLSSGRHNAMSIRFFDSLPIKIYFSHFSIRNVTLIEIRCECASRNNVRVKQKLPNEKMKYKRRDQQYSSGYESLHGKKLSKN